MDKRIAKINSPDGYRERTKQVSKNDDDHVVEIPAIVRVGIVGVQPPLAIIISLDVEHVWIAVGVGIVRMSI